jgi:hypothetical protein
VGIFFQKKPPRGRDAGDKKPASGTILFHHAPDAVNAKYRREIPACKEYFRELESVYRRRD